MNVRFAFLVVAIALMLSGCTGGDGEYDSPILNEDVPVADIADLPDIEQTRTQMLDLIERLRVEVTRLVPASEPWQWNSEESRTGCVQKVTGRKGVWVGLD
ncbi:PBP1b-binding outer membrane lipoprotein LpoB [Mycobacterium frederiksbergense]|uniref:PBP1b-binding outer membrane lipoprotein LpoB n=1 Tax=Mycolicibacterium frederiksbergense TaxID=117567 RepID=A0ABT6KX47_9MYCO|nr:PBP1b-binding outer membrane lipoprotein LpoB [Mycolicibacterium frederiksbergense]